MTCFKSDRLPAQGRKATGSVEAGHFFDKKVTHGRRSQKIEFS